jgi:starch synthase (maltosyl-transferring)
MDAPIIYNLFPRLAGTTEQWKSHATRAREMGFTWIYLNPVTYPGFSGSLYAVKDYYRVCPDFLSKSTSKSGMNELRAALDSMRAQGLRPIMDLVINHTSIDCPWVKEHPDWYVHDDRGQLVHPSAIDPADARKVTVWGDLAEIRNTPAPDRTGLWDNWKALVRFYLDLGFVGFRCDAAYKVPVGLWQELIRQAHAVNSEAAFFAETLGCRLEETTALRQAGMDYLFNSSKYWLFDAPWALEQHERFGSVAPSVSFPESHDTMRLMSDTQGNLAVQRQRYLFSAMFSKGVLMPIGYEFGFKKRLHVVSTRPTDWERTGIDLRDFIHSTNSLKRELTLFSEEGHWRAVRPYDQPTIVLERSGLGKTGQSLHLLINKDWNKEQRLELSDLSLRGGVKLHRVEANGVWKDRVLPASLHLNPAEIALVY